MAPVRRRNKNEVRRALYGWLAWSPLLAVFAFIAADMSLSIKARHADYEIGALAAQRRQLVRELDTARSAQSAWTDIRRIGELMRQLNMILPDPQQIQVVIARPGTPMPELRERPQERALEMAEATAAPSAAVSNPAVPTAPAVALPVMAPPPAAAPAVLVAVSPSEAVSVPATAAAAHPAGRPTPNFTVLDLPKEQITELDSPDASMKDLLPRL